MRSLTCGLLIACGAITAEAADPVGPSRNALVAPKDPFGEVANKVVYLSQNWSPDESNRFYFTPQGSQIIPYDWFLGLEQGDSTTPFRDNQNMLRYRYLAQVPGPLNPDGLPVGFVADQGVGRAWLGLTCAACHTTEIHLDGTAYRVDGAPTMGDVQALLADMVVAMQQTRADAAKFDRFALKVLAGHDSPPNRSRLQAQLDLSIKIRSGYNLRNFLGYDPKAPAQPPTRFGRLDAVDAIVNEVYNFALKHPDLNHPTAVSKPANAPVSYPFLWDTPQHDIVEWLGIAKNGGPLDVLSLSRNVGEVLGVFANVSIPEDPSFFDFGYPSTVKILELTALENQLKTLWSPQWPGDFPAIDQAAAAKGAVLYRTDFGRGSCVDCHALIDRTDPNRKVVAFLGGGGTDPQASLNFFNRTGPSGKLEGVEVNFVPLSAKIPAIADANTMLSNVVAGTILGNFHGAPPDDLNRLTFRRPAVAGASVGLVPVAKYKGRPLDGIWATAPYLHNGSVPDLDALLRPAAQRPKSFTVGTRQFDPARVGFQAEAAGFPRFTVDDEHGTPIPGNSNAGHEYGTGLTDDRRHQLVEYLKTL